MDEEDARPSASQMDGSAKDDDYGDVDDSAMEDDIFKNNHDLIGVQGILRA